MRGSKVSFDEDVPPDSVVRPKEEKQGCYFARTTLEVDSTIA